MSGKLRLILFIGVFVVFIGGSVLLYDVLENQVETERSNLIVETGKAEIVSENSENNEETTVAEDTVDNEKIEAPDFNIEDVDGNLVKLSDFRGKPVVVNFWASWCPPCKEEMPHFEKLHVEMGEEIQFIMVDLVDGMRETIENGKAHIEENGYTFPVYFDVNNEVSIPYGLSSIPMSVFIDSDGYVVAVARGMLDEETLLKGIEMIK
jgi:Thiol-disulfide isomerase and thioredoxins